MDNNRISRSIFPVLMTRKNTNEISDPIVSLLVKRAKNYSFIHYFKSIEVAFKPLCIKVTEGTVEDIYNLFTFEMKDIDL